MTEPVRLPGDGELWWLTTALWLAKTVAEPWLAKVRTLRVFK